jgi:hypothetical protein
LDPVLILIALVALAAIAHLLKGPIGGTDKLPYKLKGPLFTPAERSLLGSLDKAVGNQYRVFGKVRVADLVSVISMSNRSAWRRAFNRISAKHFDYVVCRATDLQPVCVIELNDKSHLKASRSARDAFLVSVCEKVSLPLIMVDAKRGYVVSDLSQRFHQAIGIAPAATAASEPASVNSAGVSTR